MAAAEATTTIGRQAARSLHVSGYQRQPGGSEKRSDGVAEVLFALEQSPEQSAFRLRPAVARRGVRRRHAGR